MAVLEFEMDMHPNVNYEGYIYIYIYIYIYLYLLWNRRCNRNQDQLGVVHSLLFSNSQLLARETLIASFAELSS